MASMSGSVRSCLSRYKRRSYPGSRYSPHRRRAPRPGPRQRSRRQRRAPPRRARGLPAQAPRQPQARRRRASPRGGRRRTPGLRREEVAHLAGVGTTWYTWLEQGRDVRASLEVLEAISRALRLTPAERTHLVLLGRGEEPPPCKTDERVSPTVKRLIENLGLNPAYVIGRRWDYLAWNAAACALFGDLDDGAPGRPQPRLAALHGPGPPRDVPRLGAQLAPAGGQVPRRQRPPHRRPHVRAADHHAAQVKPRVLQGVEEARGRSVRRRAARPSTTRSWGRWSSSTPCSTPRRRPSSG